MTYYKVVRTTPQGYKSCYCGGLGLTEERLSDRLVLTYECGKKTTPEIGKVFAFTSEATARQFAREARDHLFPVCVLVGKGRKARRQLALHVSYDCVEAFWQGKVKGCYSNPFGTVLLDHFTPTATLPR